MRLRTLAAGITAQLALMASVVAAAPDAPASPPAGPMIKSTRQHAFTIPFRIEAAASAQQQPVEVQLHVSTDEGAKWDIAARVPPERGAFVFRTPRDGQYWYSIRTVDKQGVVHPDGPLSPQLKVNVDTVAPRLELNAVRGPAGDSWCCPYQQGDLCAARGARLLGCRTYFCDAGARELGEGVYADALREIQRIAAGQGPWWYGPARAYFDHV